MSTRPRSQAVPPMTLGQHARQRRAVARGVVLTVPPPGDSERRPLARSRAGADIRPAHGLRPLRNHRCRRPTELAGTATAREPDRRAMAVSPQRGAEQHRALRLLAGAPLGATEAIMLAHDFTNAMLDGARRTGDSGTAGNEGRAAADHGDLVQDHRRRAAGTCWMIPAIDCIDRPRIAPGRGWALRSAGRNRVYRATPSRRDTESTSWTGFLALTRHVRDAEIA
jgi:hypothetical protein